MIGRLEVLPGPGTAARFGELTVWAGAGASNDLLSFLIQSARNLASLPDGGKRIADHLAGVLRQRDPEPTIPFVTVGPGEYSPVTLLHGPVQMWDGARWVRPDPEIGWLVADVSNLTTVLVTANDTPAPPSANPILDLQLGVVPGGGLAVVLTPASMRPADDPADPGAAATEAENHPADAQPSAGGSTPEARSTPLRPSTPSAPEVAGAAVAAGLAGAALAGREAERAVSPEPATAEPEGGAGPSAPSEDIHPEPESEDLRGAGAVGGTAPTAPGPAEEEHGGDTDPGETPAEPIGIIDLRPAPTDSWTPLPPVEAGAPSPSGAPTVRGLRCPRGHFNHGGLLKCAYCDLPLDPIRGQGDGPRPVLGVLVGTDRSLWRVDSSYLVGTDPSGDPAVTGGAARPLVVPDDGQAQAVHAELRATDWTLSVIDRNSRSGTFVLPPGHSDWQRLPPDQAVTLKPGTHVAIGSTVFTFTSRWPL
jgi:hypothetical protein